MGAASSVARQATWPGIASRVVVAAAVVVAEVTAPATTVVRGVTLPGTALPNRFTPRLPFWFI